MLSELRIQNLGVIESSTLELDQGLTVITGETGAGKTMVVTALGLLLGGRSDAGAVRHGARSTRIEGVVEVASLPATAAAVDAAGGEVEDDEALLVRTVSAEGRSRAFVGGAAVPVSTLASVAEPLVAVHGQSDQLRLVRAGAQREALDRFAGETLTAVLARYQSAYRTLRDRENELRETVESSRARAQEADVLRFGLQEIERVDPQPGEDLALREEESRLAHADGLRAAAESARGRLAGDETDDGAAAIDSLADARHQLDQVGMHDPALAALAGRLGDLLYSAQDVAGELAGYLAGLETDPARLAAVSARRAELAALTRKYGESVDEVLGWAQTAAGRLLLLDGSDGRVEQLRAECADLRGSLATAATELVALRTDAAHRLAAAVTAELHDLAMPHARFEITCDRTAAQEGADGLRCADGTWRFGPHGIDEVAFGLAANPGAPARPLGKGASGGELSRVMLAVEVSLAATSTPPTLVFDEVDAGVGGKAAVEVGRRLASLADKAQVIVVTHLPQVAAFADRHVVVTKAEDGSVTSSGLTTLDDGGRERELSRMLAGLEDSATALEHARELLATARSVSG